MVKFMILFGQASQTPAFEDVYNRFLALIEQMPHVTRRQVSHITGSPRGQAQIARVLEVYFDDAPEMEQSLQSSAGQAAGQQLSAFPAGSIDMVFAEVFEETGGRTEVTG